MPLCSVRHGLCSPCDRERGPRRRGGAVSGRPLRRVSAADRGPRAARVCLRPAAAIARGHTRDDAAGLRARRPDWAVDLADFERLVPAGAKRCSCRRWSASVAFRERPYARLICAKAKPESRVFAPRSMRDNCDQPRSRERRRSFPGSLQGGEMIYNWRSNDAVTAHRPSRAYPANSESCSDRTVSAAHQPSSDLTFWTDVSGYF